MRAPRIRILLLLAATTGVFSGCGDKSTNPVNRPPRFIDLIARPAAVVPGGTTRVSALVSDPDGDTVRYLWSATGGSFNDSTASAVNWTAPGASGTYTVTVEAGDGAQTVSRSVNVGVGSASLTVLSEPAGAFVTLDGAPTGLSTPVTFAPLAPGDHIAAVSSFYFTYASDVAHRTLADADADTVRFTTRAPSVSTLDPDRTDLLEIGGIAFLPDGSGVVYAARTAAGTGLFSTSVLSSGAGGIQIWDGVRMEEPLGITANGDYVLFVSDADSLTALPIQDDEGNGVVDGVGTPIRLRKNAFGPAVSRTDEIAFSLGVSEDPAVAQILHAAFDGSGLSSVQLATTTAGRLPTWKPNEPFIAFMRDGMILYNYLGDGGPLSADTLVVDGYNTAPAWGKWGPAHIAHLHGTDGLNVTGVRLAAVGTSYTAAVTETLEDPRFLAWDPTQRRLLVTQNPAGGPQILVLGNLPIP
jgi:Tol biopolymer transport system component